MCGIAGIWERSGKLVETELLERMAATLRHRGPDGSGVWLDGEVGLANQRLAIVDPTPAGDQPMGLRDRGLRLTYNGEIHNYVELRRELEAAGAEFRTQSDTEVVLRAYARWGLDCFERFNGMWALGLWDERERRLVLSRDRFGIKPLYYSVRGGRIAFASEPKAILAAFPEERIPNRDEIARFLGGAFPDTGDVTFFANMASLPPATSLVVSADSLRRTGYWGFEPGDEEPKPDAEERFRELLRDAVQVRMRSDVPVGACLSGGLDSSAIAALVEPADDRPMHCFSARYDGWADDESRFATAAAEARPGRFVTHWVRPDPDGLLDTIRKIVWHHDAPMPIRGRLAQWFVLEEAGRHVKVVLDGQGGDEVLAGYSRFVLPYLADRLRRPRPSATSLYRELADLARVESRSRGWFLALAGIAAARRAVASRGTAREHPYATRLNNALWQEFRREGLTEVLHAEDAISMAFSVESRTPFLDHRVVELCFSLPYTDKISDGWTKSLLRRALADDIPPEILARRRKLGFSSPVASWLRREDTWPSVRAVLLDRRSLDRGFVDRRSIEWTVRAFERGPAVYAVHDADRLWRRLTLELWCQEFLDPGS